MSDKLSLTKINQLLQEYFILSERKRQIGAGTYSVNFSYEDAVIVMNDCNRRMTVIAEALAPYIQIEA